MTIRTILIAAAAVAVCACAQKTSETTVIKGSIPEGYDTPDVVVVIQDLQIDTTIAVVDGKFNLSVPTCTTAYGVVVIDGEVYPFVPDGTVLTVKIEDEEVVSDKPSVSVTKRLNAFNQWVGDFMGKYNEKMGEIYDESEGLTEEEKSELVEAYYNEVIPSYNEYMAKVAKENPDNLLGLIAISQYQYEDVNELRPLIDGLSDALKENPDIVSLVKAMDAMNDTAEGSMFADFTIVQDPDNADATTVKFSDYVGCGKWVIVDFWASWCGPCRGEMPNLQSVYKQFHGDRFDMLSVAVWDDPEDSKAAAKELGIVWNQIINAQQIPTDLYGIEGIPHIILFGPDGTIVKRGLRGEAIGAAVAEALGE